VCARYESAYHPSSVRFSAHVGFGNEWSAGARFTGHAGSFISSAAAVEPDASRAR
jgi:hypothetical protein